MPHPATFAELIDVGASEHYVDAPLYDYEYRRRRVDVNFYRDFAREHFPQGASILELGCGSGRVSMPLARDGHRVFGVDAAPTMLAAAQKRKADAPSAVAARLRFAAADLRTFDLGETFDLVIAPFNVLEHLYTRVEVQACLRNVLAHLSAPGRFVFDVQMPDFAWLLRDNRKRWARTKFTHPVSGAPYIYSTNHEYDPVSQIALIRIYYDAVRPSDKSHSIALSQRKFFPAELEALVAHAGLRVTAQWGDFARAPLTGAALSQVLVCQRALPLTPPTATGKRAR